MSAHPVNIGEHPRLDSEVDCSCKRSADDLGPEHRAGRNLHVVPELEVRRECQCLRHGDITPSLEHHHGDGTARQTVANDELGDDVEADLLVGNGLNHANGDDIDERDDEG